MTDRVPEIEEAMLERVRGLAARDDVARAMTICKEQVAEAMAEQVKIAEIESPTFAEKVRGEAVMELMRSYGLTDVVMDPSGNVVGRRPGTGSGPTLAIAAHLDTVFPAGTDLKVRREGNLYYGPGIGDNASGIRSMLQVLRALEGAGIRTEGDILFVGTVGEEGNGDIRGAKALFDGSRKIDGFMALDMADVNTLQNGATGAHRWRLSIEGEGGHSYLDYGHVPSAIHAMCRAGALIADLDLPETPKTTYTIGTIKGGTTVNTIAAKCSVDVDLRSVDVQELAKLEETVLAAFEKAVELENAHWPKADAAHQLKLVKTQIGNRPAGLRPDNCPAVQAALAAMATMGIEVKQCRPSSTDANMPMSINIPAVCIGTGGVTNLEHSLKEFFDSTDMEKGPQLATLIALALVGIRDEVKAAL
ncbi:M20/M25/M40 family metallo-hydrolase [Sutterella megalosphaeroides]|uniref:Aminoacyl-histidine dipeptidase n=1 Tax=Sutterella megalosphaeroides TaxID=2494234 RepID=A0A2Z6I9W8_9BURK|nr:M20/M25/M40 family metallo-hydrolase [Sutterella megalosphaeroides]BBF23152.1 aminoacyl-histidine dipeptidase [Sutterella megalosphaeroides]